MSSPRNRRILVVLAILLLLLLLVFLTRCSREKTPAAAVPPVSTQAVVPKGDAALPTEKTERVAKPLQPEVLTPATLKAPDSVVAGAQFNVEWTGPNNPEDYITIVTPDAPATKYESYVATSLGASLEMKAPISPGAYELRYVTARSKSVLGRRAIAIAAAGATLSAPAEVVLGSVVSIKWSGPNNQGDFITIVPKSTPDGQYGNYGYTTKGSPLEVTAPVVPGEAEARYMTGQGNRVLGRCGFTIVVPEVKLSAAAEVVAGARLKIDWVGPKNAGDFITVVAKAAADGKYGNTTYARISPLEVVAPMEPGEAEIRYMTGQGNKVLARRLVQIVAAQVTLSAPTEVIAGADVEISWTGPNNSGDYITIVPRELPDGQYGNNTRTSAGAALKVLAPIESGDMEIRYMSGAGAHVLGRRALHIVPAVIVLQAEDRVKAGAAVQVSWTGPHHRGDYITIVGKSAADGEYVAYTHAEKGPPVTVQAPKQAGAGEVRYMSGQGRKVLARRPIQIDEP